LHPKEPNQVPHLVLKKGYNALIINLNLAPTDIEDMSSSNYILIQTLSFFLLRPPIGILLRL
jgi:hypothetical protein